MEKSLDIPSAWIYYKEPEDEDHVYLWAIHGPAANIVGERMRILPIRGDAYLEEIFQLNGPVYVEDARTDPRVNHEIVEQLGTAFSLTNVPQGVLAMGTFGKEGIRKISLSELEFIATLASLVAVTIDRLMTQNQQITAEAALRASEERYRSLSHLMSDFAYKIQVSN